MSGRLTLVMDLRYLVKNDIGHKVGRTLDTAVWVASAMPVSDMTPACSAWVVGLLVYLSINGIVDVESELVENGKCVCLYAMGI